MGYFALEMVLLKSTIGPVLASHRFPCIPLYLLRIVKATIPWHHIKISNEKLFFFFPLVYFI